MTKNPSKAQLAPLDKYDTSIHSLYTKKELEILYEFKTFISNDLQIYDSLYDDWFIARFLRRTSWKIEKSKTIFKEYLEFRKNKEIETILDRNLEKCDEIVKRYYPHNYCGIDKLGRPINYECFAYFDSYTIAKEITIDEWANYFSRDIETLIHVIFPYCSKLSGKRIDRNVTILDLKDFNLKPIILDKKIRQYLNTSTKIAQDYYPSLLGQQFIINAPFIFNAVWSIIKIMLNEKTKQKIKILGKDYIDELLKVCDKDQQPNCIGGTRQDFPECGEVPWKDYKDYCWNDAKSFFVDCGKRFGDPQRAAENQCMDVEVLRKNDLVLDQTYSNTHLNSEDCDKFEEKSRFGYNSPMAKSAIDFGDQNLLSENFVRQHSRTVKKTTQELRLSKSKFSNPYKISATTSASNEPIRLTNITIENIPYTPQKSSLSSQLFSKTKSKLCGRTVSYNSGTQSKSNHKHPSTKLSNVFMRSSIDWFDDFQYKFAFILLEFCQLWLLVYIVDYLVEELIIILGDSLYQFIGVSYMQVIDQL